MSLFRIIFASGNGRALASLGFVIPECLRSAFAPKVGCKAYPKWEETDLDITDAFVG